MDIYEFIAANKLSLDWERVSHRQEIGSWHKGTRHYQITVRSEYRPGRPLKTFYSQGSGIKEDPKIIDVLESLQLDASCADRGFDEWCADLGYDNDSRKAERTHIACQKIHNDMAELLADDENMELFLSVEF